jgi:NADPH-dependent curcumin reductase CurA
MSHYLFIIPHFFPSLSLHAHNFHFENMPPQNPTIVTNDALKEGSSGRTWANRKWILVRRPTGIFHLDDVKLVEEEITYCEHDEIIVEANVLSCDAFIRTMCDEEAYHGSISIGSTLPAIGYGTVVAAGPKAKFKVGSKVSGMIGAQMYVKEKSSAFFPYFKFPFMKLSDGLGLMGLTTGLTAYVGVHYVLRRPSRSQTCVVTAAAGAVGSVAAQLAKHTGARVIGVAGGAKKCKYLVEDLNLDGAIDYKSLDQTFEEQLDHLCPNGIDFIYDNVGGTILDSLLNKINPNGRVIICGAISQYSGNINGKGTVYGPSNYLKLAERGAVMKGFAVTQYFSKIPFAILNMLWLYLRGYVKMTEHREVGIASFPKALQNLFTGGHIGKTLIEINLESKKEKSC